MLLEGCKAVSCLGSQTGREPRLRVWAQVQGPVPAVQGRVLQRASRSCQQQAPAASPRSPQLAGELSQT